MPHRIPPQVAADGGVAELNPPTGGSWLRDADGGLSPADETTAVQAGLDWTPADQPAALAATQTPSKE